MVENQNQTEQQTPKKSGKVLYLATGFVVLLLIVGGVFLLNRSRSDTSTLGSQTQTVDSSTQEAEEREPYNDNDVLSETSEGVDATITQISVEGGSFYYKPNVIDAKVGQNLKVVFSAKDLRHDFVIDELDVRTPVVTAGDTATVEFTPTEAGTFEFYCSVGNHRAQGMVGKLIVTQ